MPDPRYRQADREALITLGLYAFFFVWWFVFAFGPGTGEPDGYTYVWGLPAWFFYSCVLGYPVICVVLWYVVRRFFRLMPLGDESDESGEATRQNSGKDGVAPAGEVRNADKERGGGR